MRRVEIMTAEGAALADLAGPLAGRAEPAFLLALTHGSGGKVATPDVLAVRDAGLQLGAVVALVTQPYRVKGQRAPGNAERQDAAWAEVIRALRESTGTGLPADPGRAEQRGPGGLPVRPHRRGSRRDRAGLPAASARPPGPFPGR